MRIKEKTLIKRLVKAVMYLHGTIDAMDSKEIPTVDADLELILKGKKCSVEQDSETLDGVLRYFGVEP